ncbi:MAG: DUF58 domain-containing protein [Oscillospiraceae bacterium]|nr:DUF58 domain-containing protein [Oscillospiraceae bacterium]
MEFVAILFMVIVLLAAQLVLFAKNSFRHFDYSCSFTKDEVLEGDEVGLVETISNRKWLPLPWLKSELSTSKWLEYAGSQSEVIGELRFVPSFFALKSYQKISRTWRVKCLKRGVFEIGRVDLVGSDLLGFSSFSYSAKVGARLTVLPRPLENSEPARPPQYFGGDLVVRRQLLDDPFFIAGVREYTGFEPMNRIHWTATAREGKLMVFQNQYTSRKNLAILLNAQPRPGHSTRMDGDSDFEDCVRFCAYLFGVAAKEDVPFRFLCNGADCATHLPVRTGESWGEAFALEQTRTLARLQADNAQKLPLFLQEGASALSCTELILVSTYVDDAIQSFAREASRAGVSVSVFVRGALLSGDYDEDAYFLSVLQPSGKKEEDTQ